MLRTGIVAELIVISETTGVSCSSVPGWRCLEMPVWNAPGHYGPAACMLQRPYMDKEELLLNGSTSSDLQSGHRTARGSVCTVYSLWRGSVWGALAHWIWVCSPPWVSWVPQTHLSVHAQTAVEEMRNAVNEGRLGVQNCFYLFLLLLFESNLKYLYYISLHSVSYLPRLVALVTRAVVTRTTRLSRQM